MKLLRYGPVFQERPGLLDEFGQIRDLSSIVSDIAGAALSPDQLKRIAQVEISSLPAVEGNPRIGACVGNVGKFVAVGLNYADHAIEAGLPIPTEPIVSMKATSSICGAYDELVLPPDSVKTDWEIELGIVIGTECRHIGESEAFDHIAGFCAVNDVSERAFQFDSPGQWVKAKSSDTFGPVGPWLVTADEVGDPQNLALTLEVDGQTKQNGSTRTMIFGVAKIVSYVSRFMSLQPGDIISTGTPPGTGFGSKPQTFLRAGSMITLTVEKLGQQRQKVIAHPLSTMGS